MKKAIVALFGVITGCAPEHPARTPASGNDVDKSPSFFPPPFELRGPIDSVLRLVGPSATCSGTLIEDDLVLTAHHCVVVRARTGEFTNEVVPAASMKIELGGDTLAWGRVGVRSIVVPPCGESGGPHDVAVLVLERKLTGLHTMRPRLGQPPSVGEPLEPAGFGRCGLSSDAVHRSTRLGGVVTAVVPEVFFMQASICPGDSGGPVFTPGGEEVVGIISLAAMDNDERTRGSAMLTRIDRARPVVAQARLIADGTPATELPPLACEP